MASRRLYYRVAARLRGLDLEHGRFEFSGLRTALYYDIMELEHVVAVDRALMLSRSAVAASPAVDFGKAMDTVKSLRERVAGALPYMTPTAVSVQQANEEYARRYKEYVISVVGEEKAERLMKYGRL